ncbi:hypothetical protein GN956_G4922 [Arapaima gigas]
MTRKLYEAFKTRHSGVPQRRLLGSKPLRSSVAQRPLARDCHQAKRRGAGYGAEREREELRAALPHTKEPPPPPPCVPGDVSTSGRKPEKINNHNNK